MWVTYSSHNSLWMRIDIQSSYDLGITTFAPRVRNLKPTGLWRENLSQTRELPTMETSWRLVQTEIGGLSKVEGNIIVQCLEGNRIMPQARLMSWDNIWMGDRSLRSTKIKLNQHFLHARLLKKSLTLRSLRTTYCKQMQHVCSHDDDRWWYFNFMKHDDQPCRHLELILDLLQTWFSSCTFLANSIASWWGNCTTCTSPNVRSILSCF